MKRNKLIQCPIYHSLFLGFITNFLVAQSSFLDPTFNTTGKVITSIDGSINDVGGSMVIQTDGKIIVVGNSIINSQQVFAVTRYNSIGNLDLNFGTNGVALTSFDSASNAASSVVLQNDGKIIVGGSTYDNLTGNNFAIARYNSDGTLDLNYGINGKVITNFNALDNVMAIALQHDGKLVAVGYTGESFATRDFAIARYLEDGSLDFSFSDDGKAILSLSNSVDFASSIAIQADGKIVVGGSVAGSSEDDEDFALVRFENNGTIDTTFGTNGVVTTNFFDSVDRCNSIIIKNDGKIIAAGSTWKGQENDFALAQYTTLGLLDTNFGSAGKVTTDIDGVDNIAYSIIFRDDKIIIAGSTESEPGVADFMLIGYQMNGSLDNSFGNNGTIITDFIDSSLSSDVVCSIALQNDGKIVAAGSNFNGVKSNFALARYAISSLVLDETSNENFEIAMITNPTNSSILISSNIGFQDAVFLMYDVQGKKIMSEAHLKGNYIEIDRGNLARGSYFIVLSDGHFLYKKKIVIKD